MRIAQYQLVTAVLVPAFAAWPRLQLSMLPTASRVFLHSGFG